MRKSLNSNEIERPAERLPEHPSERLHVFLAHAGVASRRASEELILEGRVTVNGSVVSGLGVKVTEADAVSVDGIPVRREAVMRYLAMHKPPGCICASSDPQGRPLALNLLPAGIGERLYNIGRLDYESSGLIFFTNDGAFAAKIGHPRANIEKEYVVKATRPIPETLAARFVHGLRIEDTQTGEMVPLKAASIRRIAPNTLSVVLVEGKNREIRRVFSHFHLHISSLRRIRIGPVLLAGLPEGATRPLTPRELSALTEAASH